MYKREIMVSKKDKVAKRKHNGFLFARKD